MSQVFANLIENSLAACADPVRVTIAWRVFWMAKNALLEITYHDNGPGMSRDVAARVFQPFFTTKTRGTGLGMTIAKRIVEAHDGSIEVANSDRGAQFVILLPRELR